MITRARLALACLCLVGCSPVASRCKDGTLLIAVTLDAASNDAEQLAVTISIDGVPATPTLLPRAGVSAAGNVVVQFPHGYPRGHLIGVAIDALVAGNVVGSGSAAQPLVSGCEVVPLTVSAGAPPDLGGSGDDLSEPPDLYTPPDLTCVPTAETGDACFDGVDNDCDGHIDCDDPDCTGGSQCVPAVGSSFKLGITVNQASFCPAMFTSLEVINAGLGPVGTDCPANLCTCTPSMNCFATVTSFSQASCTGETDSNSAQPTCRNFNVNLPTKGLDSTVITNGGGMCGIGGSSTRSATQWASTQRFCQTSAIGGGCMPGYVCVPKLSTPTCAVADNAVGCDTGYTETVGPWYTGFTDGRSCGCACGSASGGSCGTTVTVFTSNSCAGGVGDQTLGPALPQQICTATSVYHSVKINGGTSPTCGSPTTTINGTLQPMGRQTLCCRP